MNTLFISYKTIANIFWVLMGSSILVPNIVDPRVGSIINVMIYAIMFSIIFIYRNILVEKETTSRIRGRQGVFENKIILIFLAFSFFSILLGVSKEKFVDFAYFSILPLGCYSINVFFSELSKEDFFDSFNKIFLGLSFVLIYAVLFIASTGNDDRLSSATLHANTIGEYSSFVIVNVIFSIFILNKKSKFNYLILFVATLAMLKAFSKTSIMTTFIFILLIIVSSLFLYKKLYVKTLSFITFFIISIFWQASLFISKFSEYTSNSNNLETLSGRTVIWAAAFEKIPNRLFMGHGWKSTNDVFGYFFETFELVHCHNEYVNLLLEVGVIGTSLIIFVQISAIIQLIKVSFFRKKFKYIGFLLFILLIIFRSYTEISFSHGGMRFFVLYAAIIFLQYEPKQKDINNESLNSDTIVQPR